MKTGTVRCDLNHQSPWPSRSRVRVLVADDYLDSAPNLGVLFSLHGDLALLC
jgi:hypothetical protein